LRTEQSGDTEEKMKDEKEDTGRKEPKFEEALARLEKIVAEMESGRLDLDRMIARFEEGMGLVEFCNRKLQEVERRIELLVKKDDGIEAQPFEGAREEVDGGGRKG